jgi:hypothetical protein
VARSKTRESLGRRKPRREPYDRVLIVCEGSKSEPNYLKELIAHYHLSSANIEITGDSGSAPKSVVDHAIELFSRDPDYDSVFCVFDHDGHRSFDEALQRVRQKPLIRRNGGRKIGEARFEAITSVPCFEYWILLHYQYTTASMPRFADVEPYLKMCPDLSNYSKGAHGLFPLTHHSLNTAPDNADRANRAAKAASTDNPTTRMPELIRYLLGLAKKKAR